MPLIALLDQMINTTFVTHIKALDKPQVDVRLGNEYLATHVAFLAVNGGILEMLLTRDEYAAVRTYVMNSDPLHPIVRVPLNEEALRRLKKSQTEEQAVEQ